ncbi:TRAP transporter small permease [Thiovibrio sp. JS02]
MSQLRVLTGVFPRLVGLLNRLEEALLCLLLVGMAVLACVQIGLRLFAAGLPWADPFLRYLVLWAGLLGAGVATRLNRHIAIDLASRLLPAPLMIWLSVLIQLFSALVCLVLTYAAVVFVRGEAAYDAGQRLIGLAPWQLNLVFPIAFALIALRFFAGSIGDFLAALGKINPVR